MLLCLVLDAVLIPFSSYHYYLVFSNQTTLEHAINCAEWTSNRRSRGCARNTEFVCGEGCVANQCCFTCFHLSSSSSPSSPPLLVDGGGGSCLFDQSLRRWRNHILAICMLFEWIKKKAFKKMIFPLGVAVDSSEFKQFVDSLRAWNEKHEGRRRKRFSRHSRCASNRRNFQIQVLSSAALTTLRRRSSLWSSSLLSCKCNCLALSRSATTIRCLAC